MAGESRGKWGKAAPVPGLIALNADGNAGIASVSCPARGDCVAGGDYQDGSGAFQAFVVTESKGRWGKAEEVPGTPALDAGGDAAINSVSCRSAGNCSAGGYYIDAAAQREALVVTETRGHWGKAAAVPGSAALNAGGTAEILSVSCTSPGDCTAGGFYTISALRSRGMLVVQKNGKWGKAVEVAGLNSLNSASANAAIVSVSCARAADCSAVGYYEDHHGFGQALVVSQARGRWGRAMEIPGTGKLNKHGFAEAEAVSCGSSGSCSAS